MKAAASLAKDLLKIMNARNSKKPSPYDTEAEVKSIDGETAWVEIPGSNDLTPVKKTINASVGDKVKVRVSGGKAWIAGNTTAPPTDNRVADVAVDMARGAGDVARIAREAADAAEAEAQRAKEITDQLDIDVRAVEERLDAAEDDIETLEGDISTVEGQLSNVQNRVTTAEGNITDIEGDITTLGGRVSTAEGNITDIEGDITDLGDRVSDAEDDVEDVVKGLAFAQNIVGTVNWIASHSTVATETSPVQGRVYYIHNQDGTYTIVDDPTGKNPAQEGWIYLDESIQNYISSHLVLLNDGLYVIKDGQSFKNRLSASGMDVMDSNNVSNAQFGTQTRIGKESGESKMLLDSKSFKMADKTGKTYAHISDLTDNSGKYYYDITYIQEEEGYVTTFTYGHSIDDPNTDLAVTLEDDTVIRAQDMRFFASSSYTYSYVYFYQGHPSVMYKAKTTDTIVVNYTLNDVDYSVTIHGDGTTSYLHYLDYSSGDPRPTVKSLYLNGTRLYSASFSTNGTLDVPRYQAAAGEHIRVTFSVSEEAKAYTFGSRNEDSDIGCFSYVFGLDNVASRDHSVAIGKGVVSDQPYLVSIGKYNKPIKGDIFNVGIGSDDNHRLTAVRINNEGINIPLADDDALYYNDFKLGSGYREYPTYNEKYLNLDSILWELFNEHVIFRAQIKLSASITNRVYNDTLWYYSYGINSKIYNKISPHLHGASFSSIYSILNIIVVHYVSGIRTPVFAYRGGLTGTSGDWELVSTTSGDWEGVVEVQFCFNSDARRFIHYDSSTD